LVAAPVLLKQQSAHALETAGVVLDGSSFGSGRAGGGRDAHGRGGQGGHRGRRRIVMATVAAVVLVATIVAFAGRPDDGTVGDLAVEGPPPESVTSTTTTVESSTTAPLTDVTADPPPPAPSPSDQPVDPPVTDTTVPSVAPTIRFVLTDTTMGDVYSMVQAPRLLWTVTGAAAVRIDEVFEGDAALVSQQVSGNQPLCPRSSTSGSVCMTTDGEYEYVLYAYDDAGHEIARRSVTLTIGF
jgi:hypothetical protein